MKTQKTPAKQNKQPGIEAKMDPKPEVIKAHSNQPLYLFFTTLRPLLNLDAVKGLL